MTIKIICNMLASVILTAVSFSSNAIPFTNGDFSTALSGWNDASSTGTVSATGGVAQLDTGAGDDPFSATLVQGDDGFFSFGSPISLAADDLFLNFDVEFLNLGTDVTETATSFFSDYLSIALYDADDFTGASDLFFDPGIDSGLLGLQSFQLDVSSLVSSEVALSFELSDQNDGFNSRVLLDNIFFSAMPDIVIAVPEPGSLVLMMLGMLLVGFGMGRNKKAI